MRSNDKNVYPTASIGPRACTLIRCGDLRTTSVLEDALFWTFPRVVCCMIQQIRPHERMGKVEFSPSDHGQRCSYLDSVKAQN